MECNHPMISLYGNKSADGDASAAKVRIAFSRERDERSRGEKAEGEWVCKIVSEILNHQEIVADDTKVYLFQLLDSDEMLQMSNAPKRYISPPVQPAIC